MATAGLVGDKDQQFGVRELLDSLPFGPGLYLIGKLLGVWASVVIGFGGFALLTALVWLPILGLFNLGIYLDMWLVGILPLAFFTSGISTLLPAGQPTRRRAALVGVALAALIVFATFRARDFNTATAQTWEIALNPGAWLWVLFQQRDLATSSLFAAFPVLVPRLITLEAFQVALAWVVVRLWLRWSENRR